MRKFLAIVATATVLVACVGTGVRGAPDKPAVVPVGWVADFDYSSEIRSYLRRQYDNARLEGATAYVYIYLDADTVCKSRRQLINKGSYSTALRDTKVSMLNYWRLKKVHKDSPEFAFDPGDMVGAFVKISKDGDLGPIFHANGFWHRSDVPYRPRQNEPTYPTWEEYMQALQSYFVENAEI